MTVTPLLAPEITVIETVTRHPLNFYESPSWFTTELLRHVPLSGVIGEPCVGHRAIAGFYKNPEQAISQERAEEIIQAIAKGELCNN